MKFTIKTLYLSVLLLLIAFSNIAETSNISREARSKIKRYLSRSKNQRRTTSNTKIRTKQNQMAEYADWVLSQAQIVTTNNPIAFILGFLNTFFETEDLLEDYAIMKNLFSTCSIALQQIPQAVQQGAEILSGNYDPSEQEKLNSKQFCLDNQNEIRNTNGDIGLQNWSKSLSLKSLLDKNTHYKDREQAKLICSNYDPNLEQFYIRYGGFEMYKRRCEMFVNQDCNTYEQRVLTWESVKTFASQAYGFISNYGETIICIFESFEKVSELRMLNPNDQNPSRLLINNKLIKMKEKLSKLVNLFNQSWTSIIGNILLNLITVGAWGTVKAAFYIVKLFDLFTDLTFKIPTRRDLLPEDYKIAFIIGNIFGSSYMIIKTWLIGRRRKFRKYKK